MIRYKVDILQKLADAGFKPYYIRKVKLLSESSLQRFREGGKVSLDTLNIICQLLDCKIEDLIEFIPDDETEDFIIQRLKSQK